MKNKLIAAIDLGTSKIICLVGQMTDAGVRIIGHCQKPSKGIKRGEIINIQQAVQSVAPVINDIQNQLNIKLNEVFVGVSGQNIRCVSNGYQVNRQNPKELISEIEITEITNNMFRSFCKSDEEVLHVIPQSYTIDEFPEITEPIGMPGTKIEADFKILVGKRNTINYKTDVIQRAGLNLKKIILDPMAASKAILTDEEMELGVAMIDIGGGTTDLLIIQDNVVRHSAIIPFGGNAITDDIKTGCCISEKNAEQLKIEHGSCFADLATDKKTIFVNAVGNRKGKEISSKLLASIIEARVCEILEAVYYEIKRSGYKDKLKAGIVITGGSSKLVHLKELAEYVTGMNVNISTPVNYIYDDTTTNVKDAVYSTAIGLVIMGAELYEKIGYPAVKEIKQVSELFNEPDKENISKETVTPDKKTENITSAEKKKDSKNKGNFISKITAGFEGIFKGDNEA